MSSGHHHIHGRVQGAAKHLLGRQTRKGNAARKGSSWCALSNFDLTPLPKCEDDCTSLCANPRVVKDSEQEAAVTVGVDALGADVRPRLCFTQNLTEGVSHRHKDPALAKTAV